MSIGSNGSGEASERLTQAPPIIPTMIPTPITNVSQSTPSIVLQKNTQVIASDALTQAPLIILFSVLVKTLN